MGTIYRTLWPFLRRYKRSLWLGFGALFAKVLFHTAFPLFIREGVDALFVDFELRVLLFFAAGLAVISAIKGLFQYWMRVILIGISRDVEYDLRNEFFAKLVSLSSDFYGRLRTGDIMARATNDLNAVRMLLGPGVMYAFETGLTLIISLAVMLIVDWQLTIFAFLPAPLVTVAVMYFGQRIHDRFETIQAKFSDISSRVQENLSSVRLLRAYVQEEPELRRFEDLNQDFIADNIRLAKLSAMFMPLLQALVGLTFLLVLLAGGYRVLQGAITIGDFVMFNTYMGLLIWPLIAVGWVVNLVQRGRASLTRIASIFSETPSILSPSDPVSLPEPAGEIEFREVTVRYSGRIVIDSVSFRIAAGETVALVGHVGSGKSTLVRLIARLEDPEEGQVLLDGIDLRRLDVHDLRRQMGIVPQETFLFSASLGENIAWGVPDATPAEILEAAEAAGLGPDLDGFPQGLDTRVGERGVTLSGGQKQRTAIARAMVLDPRILILDDALSAVDTATEERILRQLEEMRKERTTILISHRVSTIQDADRILVLENGTIAEEGSHQELLAQGGYYADLYEKQLLEEELEAI